MKLNQNNPSAEPSSFRDPAGFVFRQQGKLYRQLNRVYQPDFDRLLQSGLYRTLTDAKLLVSHQDTDLPPITPEGIRVLMPQIVIPFVSYPYEWSFSQLKAAALATLKIVKLSLEHNMILKDAGAYNIQFYKNRPLLIDEFSFTSYHVGSPWIAYRQFCEHFLAPLALMAYSDIRLGLLQSVYIDGIPLDLAARLLPFQSTFNLGVATHIHLHARTQQHYQAKTETLRQNHQSMSKIALLGLIDSLETTINHLRWRYTPRDTEWGDYYSQTNYTDTAFQTKQSIVAGWLDRLKPKSVWDLGANTGEFSRLATRRHIPTLAFDIDPVAVETNFLLSVKAQDAFMQPLLLDLTNPSPAIGWENLERPSLLDRGPADMVLVLALVHHLAISHNLPFDKIAQFLNRLSENIIIEFVPKEDSQVQKLLATREDIFPNFTSQSFVRDFSKYFIISDRRPIQGSRRELFLLKRK